MEKQSFLKRIGAWLRGAPLDESLEELDFCEAEGDLVDPVSKESQPQPQPEPAPAENHNNHLAARTKKDQLEAMEESFNRLVEVLESLNDNVVQQREQNAEVLERIGDTSTLMRTLPANIESNSNAVRDLAVQIKDQAEQNQRIIEIIRNLPELNQEQTRKLGEILQQLERSEGTGTKIVESMQDLDGSIKGVLDNSKQQAMSLAQMGQILERSEQQVSEMMASQSKRFTWLLGIILGVSTAAIVIMAIVLVMGGRN